MKKSFLLIIFLLVAEIVVAQNTTDSSTVYNRGSHQLGLFVAPSIGSKVSSHYFLLKMPLGGQIPTYDNHYWGYNIGVYWGYEGCSSKRFDFGMDVALSYGCVYLNGKSYNRSDGSLKESYSTHFPHMQMRLSPSVLFHATPRLKLQAGVGISCTSIPFEELKDMRESDKERGLGMRERLYNFSTGCFHSSYDISLGARYTLNEHFNVGCRLQYDFLLFSSYEPINETVTTNATSLVLSCGYVL